MTFRAPARLRGRRAVFAVACVLAATGMPDVAHGDPVPGACAPHPTKVVNPGCVPALVGQVEDAVEDATTPERTFPNLVPDVQDVRIYFHTIDPFTGQVIYGGPTLYFDTRAQNFGTVPLQITIDSVESPTNPPVSQCTAWATRVCLEQERVGGFSWHAQHGHFHFEDFASYQFRRLAADGSVDYSDAAVLGRSDKVSFCLVDSARVDPTALILPVYQTCTQTVQGVSPGWTDIYSSGLPGQQFSLDGFTDGRYALVVSMNYERTVFETTYDDNKVEVIIEISGGVTKVRIVDWRR